MTHDETQPARPRLLLEPQDLVGYTIDGRFRLNDMIGQGGMGVVYRSRQDGIDRDLAIKILKPGHLNASRRLERFEREISIISSLSHPNIVRIFDSGRDPGLEVHYIAMELVHGVSLDTILRGHLLKVEFALEVAYQICGALTEPHARGIIHRDIKPENILIVGMADETVQVKVLDFGIARSQRGDGKVTTTGVVIGTPKYMAPESVQGAEIDARTDLYAVGVILYQMLVGRPPFSADTPVATMIQHVTQQAPDIEEALKGFQYAEVSQFVRSLMAKKPDDRPQSARVARSKIDEIRDLYGFGRLKINVNEKPLESLENWLIPREELEGGPTLADTESWATANSFELTRKWRATQVDEIETESGNLIPVPADVARRHLHAMGRTTEQVEHVNPARSSDDSLDEIEHVESKNSSTPNVGIMAFVVLVVVIGLGTLLFAVLDEPDDASEDLAAVQPVDELTEPVAASEETPAPAESDAAEFEAAAGSLARARGLAIVQMSHAAAEQVNTAAVGSPKTTKPAAAKRAESEPAVTTDEKDTRDEFEKGLEWLRDK